MPRYDVIIVGGGPVGLAMAVELGQRDVSVALVERHVTPQRIPKGQNLTNRTLEHFFFWNCVDELRAARVMPPGYPIGGVTAYGNLMSEYWWGQNPSRSGRGPGVAEYYYERNERLPQYCTEEVLRNRLKDLPSVTTLFGWEATSVSHDDNGVKATIAPAEEDSAFFSWSADTEQQTNQDASAPGSQVLESEYVIGCDGGRSLVRDTMGVDRSGRNFDQRMVLAVFRSKELHEGLKRFPEGTTYRVLKPELKGYWQFFGRIDVGEGFFFHAPVDRDTKPDNYDFHGLLEEAAGFKFKVDHFDHVGFWDLRVSVGSEYRKGRAFIAGDAAHQHPPYGGQGLNNGLEDAANLGWKLAAKVQGWGGEALLNSYKDERRTVFEQIGEQMIAGGIDRDRVWLENYSPDKDKAEFEAEWQKLSTGGFGREDFDPNFAGSPVIMGPPDGKTGIFATRTHAARAGFHLSPKPLSTGRNVYQELGPGFTLLAFGAQDAAVSAIEQAASSNKVPLKVIRDSYADEREAYAAHLILVRPDQYVVWAGDEAPADANAMVRKVAGL